MTASSLLDEIATFEPRTSAIKGGGKQLSCRSDACQMSIDLFQLALGQRSPALMTIPVAHELGDLADREAHLLEEPDHGEPL